MVIAGFGPRGELPSPFLSLSLPLPFLLPCAPPVAPSRAPADPSRAPCVPRRAPPACPIAPRSLGGSSAHWRPRSPGPAPSRPDGPAPPRPRPAPRPWRLAPRWPCPLPRCGSHAPAAGVARVPTARAAHSRAHDRGCAIFNFWFIQF
jgi:hypothetical protein